MTVVARPGARRTVFSFKWLVILVALGALSAFFSSSYSRFMPEVRQTQTTVDKTTSIWTDHVVEHNAIPMKEEPQPVKNETKLVWLLSFPNSVRCIQWSAKLEAARFSFPLLAIP